MKRYGQVIRLQPGAKEEYVHYHSNVWPEVLKMIHDCNIRNYSIFLKDDTLYAYFEYIGANFETDMARMAADPKSLEWWAIMEPLQHPIATREKGEWWADMEEIFHAD